MITSKRALTCKASICMRSFGSAIGDREGGGLHVIMIAVETLAWLGA